MSKKTDGVHEVVELTYFTLVWNNPKGPSVSNSYATGWSEIDFYSFDTGTMLSYNETRINALYMKAAMSKYQEYRLRDITATYEGTNNTIASPTLVNDGMGQSALSATAFAYQPYDCVMRFDENDSTFYDSPSSVGTTFAALNQVLLMEKMNGSLCFKSTDTATIKFTPSLYASPTVNQVNPRARTIGSSANTSNSVNIPMESPWFPTKVLFDNENNWFLNTGIIYHCLKFGFYNKYIMQNWKYPAQNPDPSTLRIPLGVLKFNVAYEFRMLDERAPIEWPSWAAPTLLADFEDEALRLPTNKKPNLLTTKENTEVEEKANDA